MRQLYEKSGSAARFSDFACDVRESVKGNQIPEYEMQLDRNGEGGEIVRFLHRSRLSVTHPRFEFKRFPGRRQTRGIFSEAFNFKTLPDEQAGD